MLDNNVGISRDGGPVELEEKDWDLVFDVNVKSFFLTCKHVLPVMEAQRGGAIINVSSIASLRAPRGIRYIAYNASKGAVNSFTQAVALMYADKGIRCNAILPGLMHTPMIDILKNQYAAGDYDRMIAIRDRASPTGKMGTAWDTANAALFLASDEAATSTATADRRRRHHYQGVGGGSRNLGATMRRKNQLPTKTMAKMRNRWWVATMAMSACSARPTRLISAKPPGA